MARVSQLIILVIFCILGASTARAQDAASTTPPDGYIFYFSPNQPIQIFVSLGGLSGKPTCCPPGRCTFHVDNQTWSVLATPLTNPIQLSGSNPPSLETPGTYTLKLHVDCGFTLAGFYVSTSSFDLNYQVIITCGPASSPQISSVRNPLSSRQRVSGKNFTPRSAPSDQSCECSSYLVCLNWAGPCCTSSQCNAQPGASCCSSFHFCA
jgi:hypothetical protein